MCDYRGACFNRTDSIDRFPHSYFVDTFAIKIRVISLRKMSASVKIIICALRPVPHQNHQSYFDFLVICEWYLGNLLVNCKKSHEFWYRVFVILLIIIFIYWIMEAIKIFNIEKWIWNRLFLQIDAKSTKYTTMFAAVSLSHNKTKISRIHRFRNW